VVRACTEGENPLGLSMNVETRLVLQELRQLRSTQGMWCVAEPGMKFLDQARLS